MFEKFKRRGYPTNSLVDTKETLLNINRDTLIKLSSDFHKKHFAMHYGTVPFVRSIENKENNDSVFIILPHYSFPMRKIIQDAILSGVTSCKSVRLKHIALHLKLMFAFTIPNQSSKVIAAIEKQKRNETDV